MGKVKIVLAIVSILLFSFNYSICEFFYADNVKLWWDLKVNIYSVIFAMVLFSYSIGKKGWLKFVLYIGVGLAVSSMIDKIFLNVHKFTASDLLMIIGTFIFASIDLIRYRLYGKY